MAAETQEVVSGRIKGAGSDPRDKSKDALDKLLRQCRENRTTGEACLRIQLYQGGVREVRTVIEEVQ